MASKGLFVRGTRKVNLLVQKEEWRSKACPSSFVSVCGPCRCLVLPVVSILSLPGIFKHLDISREDVRDGAVNGYEVHHGKQLAANFQGTPCRLSSTSKRHSSSQGSPFGTGGV